MYRAASVVRWWGDNCEPCGDAVVIEEPLEIRVNDRPFAITMRTPGQDAALAAGLLAAEGILSDRASLWDITHCGDQDVPATQNVTTVYVAPDRAPSEEHAAQRRYANSACGLCGAATIENIRCRAAEVTPVSVRAATLRALPERMRAAQGVFDRTGGLHAAALFTASGELMFVAEDIGRHNAVDKVIGRAFLEECWPLAGSILMVSGRAGFEIVQKAHAAGVPVVCSVSAPSSLAVDLAADAGMTLIGFLRGDRFNVYTGAEHVEP